MFSQFGEFCSSVQVKRWQGGHYGEDGIFVPATPTIFSISASVQTLQEYELEQLPEGRRVNKTYKVYTNTQLYTAEDPVDNPDALIINGIECEIIAVYPYLKIIAPHWKIIAQEKSIR